MGDIISDVKRVTEIALDGTEMDVTAEMDKEVLGYVRTVRNTIGMNDDEIEQDLIAHFACESNSRCYDDVEIIGDTVRLHVFDVKNYKDDWRSFL